MTPRPRARRLDEIAKAINELGKGYRATTRKSYSNTDRKIPGTRLRHPGRGRTGVELEVYNPEGERVLRHDSSETYRCNREVERWLCEHTAFKKIARQPRDQWWY